MVNYYEVLEISENASVEVIKASYKTLVKKYHPDNCTGGDADAANSHMVVINEAYQVLSDEDKRKIYDFDLRQFKKKQSTAAYESKAREESSHKEADFTKESGFTKQAGAAKEAGKAYEADGAKEDRSNQGESRYSRPEKHSSCLFEFIKAVIIIILLFKLVQWGFGFFIHKDESSDYGNDSYTAGEDITPISQPETGSKEVITDTPSKEQPTITEAPTVIPDDSENEQQEESTEEDIDVEIIYGD